MNSEGLGGVEVGNKLTRQRLEQITEERDLETVEKIAFPLGISLTNKQTFLALF